MDNCEICREHANGGTYYDDADCYICNLQAENAKLKKLNRELVDKSNANVIANARLDEENAKLRKVADAAAEYLGDWDGDNQLNNLEDALEEAGYKV